MQLLNREQVLDFFRGIRYGSIVKANNDVKVVFVVETTFTQTWDEYKVFFIDFSCVTIKYNSETKIMINESGNTLTYVDGNETITLTIQK